MRCYAVTMAIASPCLLHCMDCVTAFLAGTFGNKLPNSHAVGFVSPGNMTFMSYRRKVHIFDQCHQAVKLNKEYSGFN